MVQTLLQCCGTENIQKHAVTMRWCLNMLFATNAAKASIYGKRDGVLTGLAVVSGADKHNLMKQSRGWKQGTVHGVSMLPRQQMWKPDSVSWPGCHQPPCCWYIIYLWCSWVMHVVEHHQPYMTSTSWWMHVVHVITQSKQKHEW